MLLTSVAIFRFHQAVEEQAVKLHQAIDFEQIEPALREPRPGIDLGVAERLRADAVIAARFV